MTIPYGYDDTGFPFLQHKITNEIFEAKGSLSSHDVVYLLLLYPSSRLLPSTAAAVTTSQKAKLGRQPHGVVITN